MTDKKTGKSKRSSRLLAFLLVGFLIIFAGSGAMFAKELLQREKEKYMVTLKVKVIMVKNLEIISISIIIMIGQRRVQIKLMKKLTLI